MTPSTANRAQARSDAEAFTTERLDRVRARLTRLRLARLADEQRDALVARGIVELQAGRERLAEIVHSTKVPTVEDASVRHGRRNMFNRETPCEQRDPSETTVVDSASTAARTPNRLTKERIRSGHATARTTPPMPTPRPSRASDTTQQLADLILGALAELGEAKATDLAEALLGSSDRPEASRIGIAARTLARRGLVSRPRVGSWAITTAGRTASRAA